MTGFASTCTESEEVVSQLFYALFRLLNAYGILEVKCH